MTKDVLYQDVLAADSVQGVEGLGDLLALVSKHYYIMHLVEDTDGVHQPP